MEKDKVWLSVVGSVGSSGIWLETLEVVRVSTIGESWGGYRGRDVGMYVECEYDRHSTLTATKIIHWNGPIEIGEDRLVSTDVTALFRQIEKIGLPEVTKYYGDGNDKEDNIPF